MVRGNQSDTVDRVPQGLEESWPITKHTAQKWKKASVRLRDGASQAATTAVERSVCGHILQALPRLSEARERLKTHRDGVAMALLTLLLSWSFLFRQQPCLHSLLACTAVAQDRRQDESGADCSPKCESARAFQPMEETASARHVSIERCESAVALKGWAELQRSKSARCTVSKVKRLQHRHPYQRMGASHLGCGRTVWAS